MVERRLICAPYQGCIWVGQRLHTGPWLVCSRREDSLRLGKALLQSIDLIAAGFQPIVKGRAKIMQGVDDRIKLYVRYKFIWRTVLRSREVT